MPFSPIFKARDSREAGVKRDAAGMTQQRKTAFAVVDALNRMDTKAVWHLRDRSCWREIYPKSMNFAPQDNDAAQRSLNFILNTFKEFHISVHEIIEDVPARKVCLWVICTGQTVSGPWTNEYIWSMEFNEAGTHIVRWKEFVDSISTSKLFPEIMAADGDSDAQSQSTSIGSTFGSN